jgi:hypothetical protein
LTANCSQFYTFNNPTAQGFGTGDLEQDKIMSEPTLSAGPAASAATTDTSTNQQQPVGSSQESGQADATQSNGRNPAWNSLLDKLPTEFHSIIEPDLRQWDQNFTSKTQEVQSRYEPYQFLIENEIDPEQVSNALQVLAMIETDPRAFHTQMGEFYKDQWGQGQQEVSQDDPNAQFSLDGDEEDQGTPDITQHPKFQELSQNQEALATYLAQQIQQQQEAEAEAEVTADEERLKKEYGDYNEQFVFAYAVQNECDLEDAVKAYKELENQIRTQPRANDTAPPVFAPSGGVPSSQPSPGQMSDKDTRKLVAEMAQRAHNQG